MACVRIPASFVLLVFASASFLVFAEPQSVRAQDADQDGIPDAQEAKLGGNPQHKDIFVECDYMQLDFNRDGDGADRGEHTHRLSDKAVQELIKIFANAPVTNPGAACQGGPNNGKACTSRNDCAFFSCSIAGITLHLEQNQALADQRFLDFTNRRGGRNFFDIKANNFDFVNRSPYYHYCILAHDASEEMGSASGQAEIFGNDFMVTLGGWPGETGLPVGTVKDQIGTFLHELGHNLGLEHGGGRFLAPEERVKNHKPNYRSVMNYSFQVTGINGQFDFSRVTLAPLDENKLNEAVGVGGSSTRYFCQAGALFKTDAGGPIDWNCSSSSPPVKENINGDRTFLAEQWRDTLQGNNDWSSIQLNFTTSPVFDPNAGVGLAQHQRYFGAYKPIGITAGRGIDREPEVSFPEGRCLEFLAVRKEGTSLLTFRTDVRAQSDRSGGPNGGPNGIGDVCEP
ncbi:MAG TPA: hypothetical protein VNN62_21425 [Methylomirabilota bacterium]|jgi:hypothetical protein|nr:hypothetical protein [Methylomirabilota bacterium]